MIVAPVPEPVPDSLDEPVDWMTYSHQEMYRMVHDGLDLTGATAVSADWVRLGEALGEIGEELTKIVQAFAHAWQGDAADQAVHAVSALAGWAGDAGALATEVSGCITVEVDNAMRARNAMPAPVVPPHPPGPGPIPIAVPAGAGTLAASAFTGGDFAQAPMLLSDQSAIVNQQHAAHRQAAETMEQFQTDSRDVYHTVPAFSAPKIGTKPPGSPANPPAPPQPTPPQQAPAEPVPVRAPAESSPVAGKPIAEPAPRPGPVATPGPVAAPGQQPGAAPVEPARPAAASAEPAANRPAGGSMGGMPMGGMGGARKEEDLERKSPAYVKEDQDLWGLGDHVVAPPVIGEDQGRA
jgi:hypothetical protein